MEITRRVGVVISYGRRERWEKATSGGGNDGELVRIGMDCQSECECTRVHESENYKKKKTEKKEGDGGREVCGGGGCMSKLEVRREDGWWWEVVVVESLRTRREGKRSGERGTSQQAHIDAGAVADAQAHTHRARKTIDRHTPVDSTIYTLCKGKMYRLSRVG